MTTELVWSTVKPTFPEVKGKEIVIVRGNQLFTSRGNYTVKNRDDYASLFNDTFICYADLTAPVSPLPLWGVEPVMNKEIVSGHSYWLSWGESSNETWFVETPACPTEAEAILAWNRIAEALKGVER